jgi:hypothetical protein
MNTLPLNTFQTVSLYESKPMLRHHGTHTAVERKKESNCLQIFFAGKLSVMKNLATCLGNNQIKVLDTTPANQGLLLSVCGSRGRGRHRPMERPRI